MNLVIVLTRILGIYLFTQAINALGLVISMLIYNVPDFGSFVLPYLSSFVILFSVGTLLFFLPFGLSSFIARNIPEIHFSLVDEAMLFRVSCKILGLTIFVLGLVNLLSFFLKMIVGLGLHDDTIFASSSQEYLSISVNFVSIIVGMILFSKANTIVTFIDRLNKKSNREPKNPQNENHG